MSGNASMSSLALAAIAAYATRGALPLTEKKTDSSSALGKETLASDVLREQGAVRLDDENREAVLARHVANRPHDLAVGPGEQARPVVAVVAGHVIFHRIP